jgi:putative solute:sodium symporter small subunit
MEAATRRPAADAGAARVARRRARTVTLALLLAWFVVSFAIPALARSLDFRLFGWSFSYWMSVQGSLLVYLAICVAYAATMNRLERRFPPPDGDA